MIGAANHSSPASLHNELRIAAIYGYDSSDGEAAGNKKKPQPIKTVPLSHALNAASLVQLNGGNIQPDTIVDNGPATQKPLEDTRITAARSPEEIVKPRCSRIKPFGSGSSREG